MKKIRDFIEKYHMITTEDHVIAGISGGADSVCLFFVLLDIRARTGTRFTAVHVNHGLRGKAADRDEEFVKSLCEKYEVPLEIFRVHLESIAKKRKQSLEESGRIVRREAFEKVCGTCGGTKIALAHHQNDNAETLLWNLARGTGPAGLCGIRPVNGRYIRPLLCMDRGEIEEFLRQRGQGFCTDDTNADTGYTRNRLRHLVIPVLEKEVNSRTVQHMNEVMEQLRDVQEYMEERAEEAFHRYVDCGDVKQKYVDCEHIDQKYADQECSENDTLEQSGRCLIKKELWEREPDILCTMVLRRAVEQSAGRLRDVGRVHILALRELCEKQPGRSLDLPFSLKAVRTYEGVELYRQQDGIVPGMRQERPETPDQVMCPLRIPGETSIPGLGLTVRCTVFPKTEGLSRKEIPEKLYTKWFDYDIIETVLYIRTRQSGDRIAVDRAGHRQKLKSWFINEKIPAKERDNIPCIASGSEILWILGHRMSSAYQITSHTERILQIEILEESSLQESKRERAKSKRQKA